MNNQPEKKRLTAIQKRVVDSAVSIAQDPTPFEILFQYSLLCQTVLPYRDPGNDVREWESVNGNAILNLEAGKIYDPHRKDEMDRSASRQHSTSLSPVGLPFGPTARLIMINIMSEAIRTQSKEINLEDSMTAFIGRIGLPVTGYYIRQVKEQIKRLAAARITFVYKHPEQEGRFVQINTGIVKGFDLWFTKDPRQRTIWASTIQLHDEFYADLIRHAVPLDERAIKALHNNAMALDIYCWLTQKLCRIPQGKSVFVGWASLHEQFGRNYKQVKTFRRDFIQNFNKVLTQYPQARKAHALILDHDTQNPAGIAFKRAEPPVSRTKMPKSK